VFSISGDEGADDADGSDVLDGAEMAWAATGSSDEGLGDDD
jgi:hypothetical protein